MVRRTRLAFEWPEGSDDGSEDLGLIKKDASVGGPANPICPRDYSGTRKGGFELFFERLECEIDAVRFQNDERGGQPLKVEIHYYGHSMGAIVGDEVIWRHPDLPWSKITYMAAANSIRDFRLMVAPSLHQWSSIKGNSLESFKKKGPAGPVEFYTLMLHPLAESRELHYFGVPPEGSLLEWIDEMFANPRTSDDRTFGKWNNIRRQMAEFPVGAREHMHFRVFPAQEDTRYEGPGRDCIGVHGELPPPRCHPTAHGDFDNFSFWR